MCTSVPQMDVFLILMRTSLGPGAGTGTCTKSRPTPGLSLESAFIMRELMRTSVGARGAQNNPEASLKHGAE